MTFHVRSKLAEFAASIEMDLANGLDDMSETTKKIREEIVAAFPAPEEQETLEALRDGLALDSA